MTEPPDQAPVPSPGAVAVWLVLGMLAVERTPWWAAHWLAEGHDGEALRELAGLNGKDPRAVHDLLPTALGEMGVGLPPTYLAAATESFRDLAEMLVSRRADPRWVVKRVEQIIVRVQYDEDVLNLPLGHLYGLDDEWDGGWGRTPAQMKAEVEFRCSEQLGHDVGGEPSVRLRRLGAGQK
jgi:hypothetical protein